MLLWLVVSVEFLVAVFVGLVGVAVLVSKPKFRPAVELATDVVCPPVVLFSF